MGSDMALTLIAGLGLIWVILWLCYRPDRDHYQSVPQGGFGNLSVLKAYETAPGGVCLGQYQGYGDQDFYTANPWVYPVPFTYTTGQFALRRHIGPDRLAGLNEYDPTSLNPQARPTCSKCYNNAEETGLRA